MRFTSSIVRWGAALAVLTAIAQAPAHAQQLRIGLAEDADVLDPTLARTFVGRIVFAALCDKLVDIDENLKIVPQLATSWDWAPDNKSIVFKLRSGVTFQDGEKFDGEAVKFNIERHKTMQGSNRRGELAPVTSVDVIDPLTVRFNLSAPFSPLLSLLSDRAGMMVSPKAAREAGEKFGVKPVCSGPFKFVERVAQDRIVFERYAGYWNKDAIHFDRVVYLPIVDNTVRLANLQSGQLDFIERVAPTDVPQVSKESRFKIARLVGLGFQALYINVGKSDIAQKTPLGRDPRVREALELSLDRDAIVQVVMEGEALPGNAWVSPKNPYYPKNIPISKRDVAKAKALLKEAGAPNPTVNLLTPTTNEAQKLAQVVQAMASEAGFDIKIQSTEFSTTLDLADKGQFEAMVLEWSGRSDPDGNLYPQLYKNGAINYSGYSKPETDAALDESRRLLDPAERLKAYEEFAAVESKDRPMIFLYHRNWLWAFTAKLNGLRPVPDGLVRLQGLKLN